MECEINEYEYQLLEQHERNAILEISIQYCSTTASFVKINAVQAILYFKRESNFVHIFYIFIQIVQNLMQDMANKIYPLAVSSMKTGRVKTVLYSQTRRNFHLYFLHLMSSVRKHWYQRPAHNAT